VKTGQLVQRIAPALERKRTAATATAAAKAKAKRAREAKERERKKQAETERFTVEGVDLRIEMAKLIKLRAFGGKNGRLYRRPPTFTINRRTQMPLSQFGLAYPAENRFIVATWPGISLADARETLVHELVHIHLGPDEGHGPNFTRLMTAAFREAYKVLPVGVRDNRYHGRYAAALKRRKETLNPEGNPS
jgi:hypothetical protein